MASLVKNPFFMASRIKASPCITQHLHTSLYVISLMGSTRWQHGWVIGKTEILWSSRKLELLWSLLWWKLELLWSSRKPSSICFFKRCSIVVNRLNQAHSIQLT
jgi:hypothetical protein